MCQDITIFNHITISDNKTIINEKINDKIRFNINHYPTVKQYSMIN